MSDEQPILGRRKRHPTGPTGPVQPTGPSGPVPPPRPPERVTAASGFRQLGNTDREVFRDRLARTIGGPSPMLPEADAIYDALAKDGLTRLAAVMAWIERKNDTYRGYYPQSYHNAWAVKREDGSWDRYGSYTDAAKRWRAVVLGPVFADLTTLRDFIYRYAPPSENDSAGYVQMVVDGVNALPLVDGGVPQPQPEPQGNVCDLVFGGKPYTIITEHNEPTNLGYYNYYQDHGGDPYHHPGLDLGAAVGTTLYAPFAGTVTCVGTDRGPGSWGTSCAAFAFNGNFSGAPGSGVGRVELLHEDGKRSLIYGHCLACLVALGQKVMPGEPVARLGGYNSAHVHLEARRWLGSDYTIVDPRRLFPGGTIAPPLDTVDYDLWADNGNVYLVTLMSDATAYQRGDPGSKTLGIIRGGETVEAVAQIVGQDGKDWLLLKDRRRLPLTELGMTIRRVVR